MVLLEDIMEKVTSDSIGDGITFVASASPSIAVRKKKVVRRAQENSRTRLPISDLWMDYGPHAI